MPGDHGMMPPVSLPLAPVHAPAPEETSESKAASSSGFMAGPVNGRRQFKHVRGRPIRAKLAPQARGRATVAGKQRPPALIPVAPARDVPRPRACAPVPAARSFFTSSPLDFSPLPTGERSACEQREQGGGGGIHHGIARGREAEE